MNYINNSKNYYEEYFIDDKKRPLVIISPGGGYKYTSVRESKPVALMFNSYGYHSVICHYREDETESYPIPGQNLAYVFNHFKNDNRVSKLIGIGFSAGGHNLLEMTVHNDLYKVSKPDLIILGYPVISSNPEFAHIDSFKNLLLDKFNDSKLLSHLSLENEITNKEPDLFLFGTITDESVNATNSIKLLEAYHKNKLNVEYHLFPNGGHGLSLATKEVFPDVPSKVNPYFSSWVNDCIKWLDYKINKDCKK